MLELLENTPAVHQLYPPKNEDVNANKENYNSTTTTGPSCGPTSLVWEVFQRAVCQGYELWELSCDPTGGSVRHDVHSLHTIKRIPKSVMSELQNSYIPSTRSVVRSSSQRILQHSTATDAAEEEQSSQRMKKNNDADETNKNTDTDTDTETVTLSVSSSSAASSLSSSDDAVDDVDDNFQDDNIEDDFEDYLSEAYSFLTSTSQDNSSREHEHHEDDRSNRTLAWNTILQAKLRTLDSKRTDIPGEDVGHSSSIPGQSYTYADDRVQFLPNYHQHQQQLGYRVIAETTAARKRTDKSETDINRTGINTNSTGSRFCCDATAILATVFRTLRKRSPTIRGRNRVLDDGRILAASETTTPSVEGAPGQTTTPAVTATTTVPPATRRPTAASVTTLDSSSDEPTTSTPTSLLIPSFQHCGSSVVRDDLEVERRNSTKSSENTRQNINNNNMPTALTVTTKNKTSVRRPPLQQQEEEVARVVPLLTREQKKPYHLNLLYTTFEETRFCNCVTTLDPSSDDEPAAPTTTMMTSVIKDDPDVELLKNTKSSEDKPRTSFPKCTSSSVVTDEEEVELRNNTKASEATSTNRNHNIPTARYVTTNHTRVIRQQQQQQQPPKIVVPLLARKHKKSYHSNVYKKIKTRLFNVEEKTNNTTPISMDPQGETTKSRTTTTTCKKGRFLSVLLPNWRRRRHNFVTEPR